MEQKVKKDSFGKNTYTRFATKQDIDGIMQFIHDYWAEDHILARDREIFEFQYVYGDEVCFVLSLDKETEEIEGILGYIPYDTEGERDIFTALWKVKKSKNPFQGMDQLYFLEEHGRCRNLYCVGINRQTFSIYKYMKKTIADLEHYYMLNDLPRYRIAQIHEKKIQLPASEECSFHKLQGFEELEQIYSGLKQYAPVKSLAFLKRRYFEHPEYEYRIYRASLQEQDAVIIGRIQEHDGARVYRIMDILGAEECFAAAGSALHELMVQEGFEYIDLYEYGMSEEALHRAGFVKAEPQEQNVIPNYFEPFVPENIEIHIFHPKNVAARMFKGDGDQDRPNFRSGKKNSMV